ncbi:MAG TPA: succinate--CoA ligase subunit alpha, partial [Hansschlegelia sp.]
MAILLSQDTRVLCQGMTGWAGTHHTIQMMEYGTKVVAGVRPGKGGRSHLNLPIFDTVAEAKGATGANASIIFVPPATAA